MQTHPELLIGALEAAANGIVITDNEGVIVWANDAFTTLTGYSVAEAVGKKPSLLKSGKHERAVYKNLWDTILAGRVWHGEIINRRKDGTFYTEEMTITPLKDSLGKIAHFVAVKQDVTERKRIEQALEEAQRQTKALADDLEKRVEDRTTMLEKTIAELEAFSYSLAHDMRAPLRAIQGYLQIVLENLGTKIDAADIDFMQKAVSAAQRMDRMVLDMKTFTQIVHETVVIEPMDVGKLIWDIIQKRPELQPPQAEITVASPLPEVMGNEASLIQCFINLLDNAVKFVAPGVKPQVHVYSEQRDSVVRLWFVDNGIGIEADAQRGLFKLFQRGHSSHYTGTGIGLAIVRKSADRMGGEVGVESEVGKGSRFWLQLPGVKK
jgi:PAS domain S-box-containing protein